MYNMKAASHLFSEFNLAPPRAMLFFPTGVVDLSRVKEYFGKAPVTARELLDDFSHGILYFTGVSDNAHAYIIEHIIMGTLTWQCCEGSLIHMNVLSSSASPMTQYR